MKTRTVVYKISDSILIVAFIAGLWLPMLGFFFRDEGANKLGEKRLLAKPPVPGKDSLKAIPEKFESFYRDHFGFRSNLVRGHNWLKYKMLKGGSVGKVMIGQDDWLFLTEKNIIANFLGHNKLTQNQLKQLTNLLQRRHQWLSKKGVRYLFVVAPNKASIYPEKLPEHISRRKGKTQLHQLFAYLRENSTVQFVDLKKPFFKCKSEGLVYHPRDSHWTERGAFIACREICKSVSKWLPAIKPKDINDFKTVTKKCKTDLATMLGLGEELAEKCEILQHRIPCEISKMKLKLPENYPWPEYISKSRQFAYENEKGTGRLLLFHDSFGVEGKFRRRLGEKFARSAFVAIQPDFRCLKLMVEQQQPDVVIQEVVERNLLSILE